MIKTQFCFSCGSTKEPDCFTESSPNKPAICNYCASKITAKRKADKRKKSGEAIAELQLQQKLERDAKTQDYYKTTPKANRPTSNVRQHKANLDSAEERAMQRKINDEIGL